MVLRTVMSTLPSQAVHHGCCATEAQRDRCPTGLPTVPTQTSIIRARFVRSSNSMSSLIPHRPDGYWQQLETRSVTIQPPRAGTTGLEGPALVWRFSSFCMNLLRATAVPSLLQPDSRLFHSQRANMNPFSTYPCHTDLLPESTTMYGAFLQV